MFRACCEKTPPKKGMVQRPCPAPGSVFGPDEKWRCTAHHSERYPVEAERDAIENEDA